MNSMHFCGLTVISYVLLDAKMLCKSLKIVEDLSAVWEDRSFLRPWKYREGAVVFAGVGSHGIPDISSAGVPYSPNLLLLLKDHKGMKRLLKSKLGSN